MESAVQRHWRGPRWALALLLAGLASLGPFAIDTYLPAFDGMAASLAATPLQLQQTLSAYLAGFALMNLFHGALADAFGRRPVVLVGLVVFALASAGCALAQTPALLIACRALQGLSAGVGMVISRVIVRDLHGPIEAQRTMSQMTLWLGIAPALAPLIGGLLFEAAGWRSIFWFLAALGAGLAAINARWLPETLEAEHRQSFRPLPLMRGYRSLVGNARFLALTLASSVPFNGMFLYVLAAPTFLGQHLKLLPTQFFWFFFVTVTGLMAGAFLSGRLAGRFSAQRQIGWAFVCMLLISLANVVLHLVLPPDPRWSILPVALYALGWSMSAPAISILLMDHAPDRRGMASSVQSSIGSAINALVAGVVVPLVMVSVTAMAWAALAFCAAGFVSWIWVRRDAADDGADPQARAPRRR